MKISVEKDSPFYNLAAVAAVDSVMLNGEVIEFCFEFDTDEGYIRRYKGKNDPFDSEDKIRQEGDVTYTLRDGWTEEMLGDFSKEEKSNERS